MPQAPLKIKPHLSHEEITKQYRKCKNPTEKSRWHLIWLMNNPENEILVTKAAKTVGFCQRWARTLVNRYNKEGIDGLSDKRKNNRGRTAFLTIKQQKELKELLTNKRPSDGGLWTGPKVAQWIKKKTKKHITAVGAWKWIIKSGFSLQVPRPKNIKSANEKETKKFKKKVDNEFIKTKKENPDKQVEIWAQDEARLGLQPTVRRTWSPKGIRFIAKQTKKFQWIYVFAFVHPLTGKSFWLILPTVNTTLMNMALKEFSDYVDPKNEKIILLLMDNAGWHNSNELKIPKNIRIFPLPPYSPELQPVECGWPLLKESVANRYFDDLDKLENVVFKRCEWILKNPEILKGAVGFNWIQEIESRID